MKNEELKELIGLHTQGVRAEIKATGDLIDIRINCLEKKLDNNHKVVDRIDKETIFVRLMYNHPRKTLFIVVLVIFGFIFLSSNVEFKDLLFFIKR